MTEPGGPRPPLRAERVEQLFADTALGGHVVAFELWGPGDESALIAEEAAVVASAVEGRRTQFAAGRQCAHRSIQQLRAAQPRRSHDDAAILPDANRAPQWPSGIVGSISHTEGYAVAVATDARPAAATVGIDAEQLGRVADKLFERLFLPQERAYLATLSPAERDRVATVMFGAKEAYYKAQYPLTEGWVGFHDVELQPEASDPFRFTLRPATGLAALEQVVWPLTATGSIRGDIAITAVVAIGA